MGQISGEELTKLEKMQGLGGREEKILVLVRLRPLNEKEITANEVADWECINDTTILYRNSLREGSLFPSAYTFDRVFRGDCSTREVYEEGAKQIALSVVSGINSSIFAYGQTSSGKTYTMNGITERTVADIFDYVHRHEERAFVLKFSAIEIYNEAIRDLLTTDNTPLRLRDDPDKGTIVEKVTEETLKDWNHFNELVSLCEAQRQIGETSLNERSSRSHQILRVTVESSAREFLGKDNSTTLSASVNFVDLAGSERASQALSAGARLKEGCHINRSLLTLGTVIRKLSKGRQGHINYRDSKLTRILQPALGGNARTAIICTLSPARSHVEQTRNTLLFACCAKEVTTKAQVNVVMSDKALLKHLQKEVARLESELKSPAPVASNSDYVALLRKKDLQIEKLEKEVKELIKQRDLAQTRVQDLLQLLEDERDARQSMGNGHHPNWKVEDAWEDDCSESESSLIADSYGVNARKLPGSANNGSKHGHSLWENTEENSVSDDSPSPPLAAGQRSVQSSYDDSNTATNGEVPDEYCKDVRCIETGERESASEAPVSSITELEPTVGQSMDDEVTSQNMTMAARDENGEVIHGQNLPNYGALEQRLSNVHRTIESLITQTDEESPQSSMTDNNSKASGFKFRTGKSCRTKFFNGSAPVCSDEAEDAETTPPNELENGFPGRPEGTRKFLPLTYDDGGIATLSRNGSQSSVDTASVAPSVADEEITSVQTFVAGMKEMADAYEKQLAEKDVVKNARDAAFNPVQEALADPSSWPEEFQRKQRKIIELWQTCNVPLVHRTYFFLLFRGDPTDSIYIEVELRRLTFIEELIRDGAQAVVADGRTVTLNSSIKQLNRERAKLSRMMGRRLLEEEREHLFIKWGIGLDTKRRKLRLANLLWSDTDDMDRIMESAAIIAKLVRFPEQANPMKGMLGFSFGTSSSRRRSFGWMNGVASLPSYMHLR